MTVLSGPITGRRAFRAKEVFEKLITKTKEMRSIKHIRTLANCMGGSPLLRWQKNETAFAGW
jgi:hypothetical protein